MKSTYKFLCILQCIFFGSYGCTSRLQVVASPPPPALEKAVRISRVIVSGQPTEEEIRSLKSRGIFHVFNVRSPEEMKDKSQINYDEAALVKEMGIEYVNVPISGDQYPYRNEVLEAFASMVKTSKDSVLLHCKAGVRARWLMAAYEIKYLGKSPNDVIRSLQSIKAWPLPVEQLTGIPLKIEIKE
jgi:protein tyrosine phosphatase (PTP) superfamily phosphohydrolase (DUF442 family)